MFASAWSITLIPAALAILATAVALKQQPGARMVSAIQHFAAGVIFAAAAGEILPDVIHGGSPMATFIGGTLGVLAMLAVKQLETLFKGATGLLAMIGFDLLVDGLILGIGFAASAQTGLLLTLAISLEVIFLGLALSVGLARGNWPTGKIILTTAALMALLPIGALLATPVALLSQTMITGFLTFGLIALLFLVTEELLVEAHETPESPWITAMFFAGFLALLLLEELML